MPKEEGKQSKATNPPAKKKENTSPPSASMCSKLIPVLLLGVAVFVAIFLIQTPPPDAIDTNTNTQKQQVPTGISRSNEHTCEEKKSMFSLSDSHNPHYDQEEMMKQYRLQGRAWTWYTLPNLTDELENTSPPTKILQSSEEPRWHVEIGRLRLTFLTSQMLRIEWDKESLFQDEATIVFSDRQQFMADPSNNPPIIKIFDESSDGKVINIQSKHLHIRYGAEDEKLNYVNSPPLNARSISIDVLYDSGELMSTWIPGLSNRGNLGGTVRTLDRTSGAVPLEPGLLSKEQWTFIDDTNSPFLIPESSGSENEKFQFQTWPAERNPPDFYVDWYLFGYGYQYKECLYDYSKVAGKMPLPPKYAFGIWWSRWWNYSDKELTALVGEFKENGVPLDNLVIDMDWHLAAYDEMNGGAVDRAGQPLGWTGYSWNYTLFECPSKFLSWCHDEGLHTTLNLHPAAGIQPHEFCYPEVARAMDIDPTTSMHVPFDIADRKFTRNYFDLVIHPLEEEGIDFWWLDYQQLQVTNITNLSPTLWLNHCFFNDMERPNRLENGRTTRGLIFHRWGGLGSHRYQIGFSGDTTSNWDALDFQVFFTTTAANVAFGYWSHDIGGFMSNRPTHPELFTRWVQWGILSPIYRTHAWRQDYLERRIWKYPAYYSLVMTEAIHLRYSLLPFLYTEARRSYDTGVSMLYPIYYDFPLSADSYTYKTQGFLGPNILIAPATTAASEIDLLCVKQIYLPGESEWIEWHSLSSLNSGIYDRNIAIDEIPIYIRAGSIIPMMFMDSSIQNLHFAIDDPLVLSVFPGTQSSSGSYRLYEDDGISTDYRATNAHTFTQIDSFAVSDSTLKQWEVRVHPQEGTFVGVSEKRSYLIRLVGQPIPARISVQGKEIHFHAKEIHSGALRSFMHWSMSRDASHNFIGEEEPESGWFYDYEHFAIVIKTGPLSRSELSSIVVEWNENVSENWDSLLGLLHGGDLGLLNSANRVALYAGGAIDEMITDCTSLPKKLESAPVASWPEIFAAFRGDFEKLVTTTAVLPAKAADKKSAHLLSIVTKHLRNKFASAQ